jgi:hypothetical protein
MPLRASRPPRRPRRQESTTDKESTTGKVAEWFSVAGLFELPHRLYAVARTFGGFWKASAVLVAILLPIVKYEWAPRALEAYANRWADQYGIDLQAREWSFDLLSLTGTARDLVVRTSDQYSDDKLFQANAVTIELSLWRRLGPDHRWIRQISIDGPTLHLERLVSGRWNWQDALGLRRAVANRIDEGFDVPHLSVRDMRLQWVENLPGDSGGGIVETGRASIYMDDVKVRADDLAAGLVEPRQVSFAIEARTADGQISARGGGFVFDAPQPPHAPAPTWRAAQLPGTGAPRVPPPRLNIHVALVNVGAAAMGQIMPLASIVPASGWITGTIDFKLYDDARLECNGDLNLRNVAYEPNLHSAFVRANATQVVKAVRDLKVSGRVLVPCSGDLNNQLYRPGYALEAAMTHEAVKGAPPLVRQAALFDQKRMVDLVPPQDALNSALEAGLAAGIGNAASRLVGQEAGTAIGHSLGHSLVATSGQGKPESAVTRGAKSIGHGFKRLFGKDKD